MNFNHPNEGDDYYGDTVYAVWRRGGNPDVVDYDRLDVYRDEGLTCDQAADREIKRSRAKKGIDHA